MSDVALFRGPQRIPSLEEMLTGRDWFGLETASNVQRALCRALDGAPMGELATDPDVIASFGGLSIAGRVNEETGRGIDNPEGRAAIAQLPASRPKAFVLCSGIRGGKSLLSGAAAARAALTCDVRRLNVGDVPRVAIVSTTRDVAKPTWDVLVARVMASPNLRRFVVGEPTTERLVLRHQTGIPVEICVVAGARAASTLVARWLACAIFDEAPRMVGEDDGVVNLDDMLRAIRDRMLDGAQILLPGSPWAPFGPVYKMVQEGFGRPSPKLVVVRSSGPMMNPAIWDAEKVALSRENPDTWRVDGLGDFMDPASSLFSESELMALVRPAQDPDPRRHYVAAMDPATRGNAWTLVIGALDDTMKLVVERSVQWVGSAAEPLSPRDVFHEMAPLLAQYRVTTVRTDEWASDALRDLAAIEKLWLVYDSSSNDQTNERMRKLRDRVTDASVALPNDLALIRDLFSARKVVTPTGHKISLPRTSDGRHCDYVPALLRLVGATLQAPDAPTAAQDSPEAFGAARAAEKEAARKAAEARNAVVSRKMWRSVRG